MSSTHLLPQTGHDERSWVKQLLIVGGDSNVRTVIAGLAILWVILAVANPRFLTPDNLTNVAMQIAAVSLMSVGACFVLLMAEVDLSMGSVCGLSAAVMGVLSTNYSLPAYLAIAAALGVGLAIGLLQGLVITRFGVPSFVVTLGGLLAWQGAQLWVLNNGNINIVDQHILALTSLYLSGAAAWALASGIVAALALLRIRRRKIRQRLGLPVPPLLADVISLSVYAAAMFGAALLFSSARGLPLAVLIVGGLCVIADYVLLRRPSGRHLYAIGSNIEAARRTGVAVNRVRITTFALASTMASCSGVFAASRLQAVNNTTGAGTLLLLAIAGAIVGGVSMFGGVGRVWYALLGSVIVGSIANGMDLLAMESSLRFMVTGGVLVMAVVIDASARRRRAAQGR